jgi:hypothetical protein
MADPKETKDSEEIPKQISRRKFAIGSVAMLGGYSLAEAAAPLSPEAQAMKLEISEEIHYLMDVRHILEEDVRRVIENAEKTGEKLYETGSGSLLARLRHRQGYFYAEYSPVDGGGYRLHAAYSHRFLFEGDPA